MLSSKMLQRQMTGNEFSSASKSGSKSEQYGCESFGILFYFRCNTLILLGVEGPRVREEKVEVSYQKGYFSKLTHFQR